MDEQRDTGASPSLLLNRYRIEQTLGEGGLGTVVLAFDTVLDRLLAIKTLKRSLSAADPAQFGALEERFRREARAGSRLGTHPNVVTVYDLIADAEGTLHLILEYAPGGTLGDRLAHGPLPVPACLRLTADVARGLQAAHDVGIVHRDIKPANIFLATDGRAQVGDFGIAQIDDLSERTQATMGHPGTPLYMSPEQTKTTAYLRPASDQYSLGMVLFAMLTGTAYRRVGERAATALLATQPPAVAALINRLLMVDPDARYASMRDDARRLAGGGAHARRAVRPDRREHRNGSGCGRATGDDWAPSPDGAPDSAGQSATRRRPGRSPARRHRTERPGGRPSCRPARAGRARARRWCGGRRAARARAWSRGRGDAGGVRRWDDRSPDRGTVATTVAPVTTAAPISQNAAVRQEAPTSSVAPATAVPVAPAPVTALLAYLDGRVALPGEPPAPDGKIFTGAPVQLVGVDLQGTEPRPLPNVAALQGGRVVRSLWAPRGTRIATVVRAAAAGGFGVAFDLLVTDLATAATVVVARGINLLPSWSPDGTALVYGLLAGTRPPPPEAGDPTPRPSWDIHLVNPDGTGDRVIANVVPFGGACGTPPPPEDPIQRFVRQDQFLKDRVSTAWAVDGSRIAVAVGETPGNVFTLRPDGSELKQVGSFCFAGGGPDLGDVIGATTEDPYQPANGVQLRLVDDEGAVTWRYESGVVPTGIISGITTGCTVTKGRACDNDFVSLGERGLPQSDRRAGSGRDGAASDDLGDIQVSRHAVAGRERRGIHGGDGDRLRGGGAVRQWRFHLLRGLRDGRVYGAVGGGWRGTDQQGGRWAPPDMGARHRRKAHPAQAVDCCCWRHGSASRLSPLYPRISSIAILVLVTRSEARSAHR